MPTILALPHNQVRSATLPYVTAKEVALYQADDNAQLHGGLECLFRNYHYAFSFLSYRLCRYDKQQNQLHQSTEEEREALFAAINQELFGGDAEALTIHQWSTDWADSFADGQQWWGSFLWTV